MTDKPKKQEGLSLEELETQNVERLPGFLKQALGWTTPHVRHPEQADRWAWLMVAAFTQLRLARPCVAAPTPPTGPRTA